MSLAWGLPQTVIEQSVSARDVNEMVRFYREDPWGSERDNIHAGFIASMIGNAFRGKKGKALTFQDFMLTSREQHAKKKTGEFISSLYKVAKKKKKNSG